MKFYIFSRFSVYTFHWKAFTRSNLTCISLIRYNLPLEKGVALHLNKIESPHPRMLCAKFGWNWPSGSVEDENVKSLQTDERMDEERPGKLTRFQLKRAKKWRWVRYFSWFIRCIFNFFHITSPIPPDNILNPPLAMWLLNLFART